jgi:hypothetical protein
VNARSHGKAGHSGLVPPGLRYRDAPNFIRWSLGMLTDLETEPSVRQYLSSQPEAHSAILELSSAVAEAGVRVHALAPGSKAIEDHLRLFTPEEIWVVDLAIDVAAMLSGGGGIDSTVHELVIWKLRDLDSHVHSHHWHRAVRKAGDGPAEFRDLRAHVPHHRPHPA